MPGGIDGKELAERLQTERPELKVIFMSGYNPYTAGKVQPHGCFLQKPFSIEMLTGTVSGCLNANLKTKEPAN
jgi:DNA-binding NtrC family response regulator